MPSNFGEFYRLVGIIVRFWAFWLVGLLFVFGLFWWWVYRFVYLTQVVYLESLFWRLFINEFSLLIKKKIYIYIYIYILTIVAVVDQQYFSFSLIFSIFTSNNVNKSPKAKKKMLCFLPPSFLSFQNVILVFGQERLFHFQIFSQFLFKNAPMFQTKANQSRKPKSLPNSKLLQQELEGRLIPIMCFRSEAL